MTTTKEQKQLHNDVMRRLGFSPREYVMVDDIYYNKDGSISMAAGKCGCKGKRYEMTIADVAIGDICDKCNTAYKYAQRRQYP